MSSQSNRIEPIADIVARSKRLLFITGAGLSADSGLPTYRGIGGLYADKTTEEGLPIETILSGSTFQEQPELTWKYLGEIAAAARGTTFNRGHEVIVEMERSGIQVCTLTQNVDGFHRLAGSRNVIEIHGTMHSLTCLQCRQQFEVGSLEDWEIPPRCRECQTILKPDVVLFGEMLPDEEIFRLQSELEAGFDAVFAIGTSGVFPYIQEPFIAAQQAGLPAIEINPVETVLSEFATNRLAMNAAEALDQIWNAAKHRIE